jgi:hypothetical protein
MDSQPVNHPEYDEQCAFVAWFRAQYPKYAKAMMSNMAGQKLAGTAIQRKLKVQREKKAGFKSGVSDIQIAVPNHTYHGLWIEFKAPGKPLSSLSVDQVSHIELMNALGYQATWVNSADKAIAITKEYMRGVDIL